MIQNRDSGFGNSSFKSSLDKRSSGIGGISQDELTNKKSKSDPKLPPNGAKKSVANTPASNKSKKDMIQGKAKVASKTPAKVSSKVTLPIEEVKKNFGLDY